MRLRIIAPSWECLGGRMVIGDEYVPRKLLRRSVWRAIATRLRLLKAGRVKFCQSAASRFDASAVADTYLLLTKRFREDLKHAWANDFNCGAFAMNRLAPPNESCLGQKLCAALGKQTGIAPLRWLKLAVYLLLVFFKRYFSLTALYGLTAGYGRSIIRPILSIVAVNLCAGLLYAGLRDPFFHIPRVTCLKDAYSTGIEAMSDAISVVTLRASPLARVYAMHTAWATLVAGFHIVLTAIMVALTVFAVRRRFRHG